EEHRKGENSPAKLDLNGDRSLAPNA
ncbi:unnamed protein product, partial [Adineta steineri]